MEMEERLVDDRAILLPPTPVRHAFAGGDVHAPSNGAAHSPGGKAQGAPAPAGGPISLQIREVATPSAGDGFGRDLPSPPQRSEPTPPAPAGATAGVLTRTCSALQPMFLLLMGCGLATYVFVHGTLRNAAHVDPGQPSTSQPGGQGGASAQSPSPPAFIPPPGPPHAWALDPPSCGFKDFVGLMACRHGYNDECCAGYIPFLEHQCVCAFDTWPKTWIPADASPGGWMANLMKCNHDFFEIANFSKCLDQVGGSGRAQRRSLLLPPCAPSTQLTAAPRRWRCAHTSALRRALQTDGCNPPRDGDLRLTTYHRGELRVFRDGSWGAVCAKGFSLEAAHTICRQIGYVSVRRAARQPRTANAPA